MTTPTSASIIAAARDNDLFERAVALGSTRGFTRADVEAHRTRIAASPVDDGGNTVASVYEYAVANYDPAPRPGEDPSAVTDTHLLAAIESVLGDTSA